MNDEMDTQRFRIRMDDDDLEEAPDTAESAPRHDAVETVETLQYNRLNRRLILIATLIPVLFAIAIVFVYLDLRLQSDQTRQTGINEILGISRDMNDRLNSLNARAGGLQSEYEERIAEIDRMIGDVSKKLRNADASIDRMRTTQVTADDIAKAVRQSEARLDKSLAAIRGDLKGTANSVSELTNTIRKIEEDLYPLTEIVNRMRVEALKMEREMETLRQTAEAARKIDQLHAAHDSLKKQVDELSRRIARQPVGPTPVGDGIKEQDIRE